jgi:hypothetical protein
LAGETRQLRPIRQIEPVEAPFHSMGYCYYLIVRQKGNHGNAASPGAPLYELLRNCNSDFEGTEKRLP